MAKRFTDTELWEKEWFMNLNPTMKCLVSYVRDKCDLAGIWTPNWTLAKIFIGDQISESDLLNIDGGNQFVKLENGKIYCEGFIEFQYGMNLNESSPVHRKILLTLEKNGITFGQKIKSEPQFKSENQYPIDRVSDTLSDRVCNTLQEKEKEKEEVKVKERKGGTGGKQIGFSRPDVSVIGIEFTGMGSTIDEAEKFFNYYESIGWRVGQHSMKDWKAAARNWLKKNNSEELRYGYSPPRHQPEISKHDKFFSEMAEIGEKIISEHNQKLNRNGQPLELAQ